MNGELAFSRAKMPGVNDQPTRLRNQIARNYGLSIVALGIE